MTPPDALFVAKQTLLVLLPELLLLLAATAIMTAGPFVKAPRRLWGLIAAGAIGAALIALIALRHTTTDPYSAVALNDAFAGYARLGFLLTGLVILALAHDQVDDARAPSSSAPCSSSMPGRCSSPRPMNWCSCSSAWNW